MYVDCVCAVCRSCWYSNEFVRGSYSFDGLEAKEADRDNLAAPIRHTASKKVSGTLRSFSA